MYIVALYNYIAGRSSGDLFSSVLHLSCNLSFELASCSFLAVLTQEQINRCKTLVVQQNFSLQESLFVAGNNYRWSYKVQTNYSLSIQYRGSMHAASCHEYSELLHQVQYLTMARNKALAKVKYKMLLPEGMSCLANEKWDLNE